MKLKRYFKCIDTTNRARPVKTGEKSDGERKTNPKKWIHFSHNTGNKRDILFEMFQMFFFFDVKSNTGLRSSYTHKIAWTQRFYENPVLKYDFHMLIM